MSLPTPEEVTKCVENMLRTGRPSLTAAVYLNLLATILRGDGGTPLTDAAESETLALIAKIGKEPNGFYPMLDLCRTLERLASGIRRETREVVPTQLTPHPALAEIADRCSKIAVAHWRAEDCKALLGFVNLCVGYERMRALPVTERRIRGERRGVEHYGQDRGKRSGNDRRQK